VDAATEPALYRWIYHIAGWQAAICAAAISAASGANTACGTNTAPGRPEARRASEDAQSAGNGAGGQAEESVGRCLVYRLRHVERAGGISPGSLYNYHAVYSEFVRVFLVKLVKLIKFVEFVEFFKFDELIFAK
jgi:hypothetical protein